MIEIASADESQLLNAMKKGEIVLVLGAGASATSTNSRNEKVRQSWSLAKLLAEEGGLTYDDEDLPDVVGAVVGPRISKDQFYRILSAEYTKITPSEELTHLLDYTWRRLYTWNIDDSVENIRSGVQRRRYFNGMIDKVISHEGLAFLSVIHLHGEALKPEHGTIFSISEYNAKLNTNTHDWYREAAADYSAFTPVFIGSKLKELILSAELDRARPNPDASLGRAFLVTPDKFSDVNKANLEARNICVIPATLAEFVDWLRLRNSKKVTPVDVANTLNAFARELTKNKQISAVDVDATRTVRIRTWTDARRSADALRPDQKEKLGRAYLEGSAPNWEIAATDIPVWLSNTTLLYEKFVNTMRERDRLFVVHGQSGSGKTTALLQCMLKYMSEIDNSIVYEFGNDTPSIRAALNLIRRLHKGEHVIIYLPDMFPFADTILEDIMIFPQGMFTVVSSARSGEWRDHIERRVGHIARSFQYQRFEEDDYDPLIARLLDYVPAPRFRRLEPAERRAKLRGSRSQLLIALKETTESAKFNSVITQEFELLPDSDSRAFVLLVGLATIARTGLSLAMAREVYALLRMRRTFEEVWAAASAIVPLEQPKRISARHELYVRHIFDNVAPFGEIVDVITSLLTAYTKYHMPIVKSVDRLDAILFKFLLNHNFIAELAKRRNDMDEGENVYSTFEIAFQLDGHFWLQYGEYLVEKDDLERALDALNKSIQAYPRNPYAVHAYADVQLRVAARRSNYDAVTIQLIGEAVRALELQQVERVETDQYPLVTLADRHVGVLIRHGQDDAAKQMARRYFTQLEELSKINGSTQVQRAKERLAHYLLSNKWSSNPRHAPANKSEKRRKLRRE